MKQLAAGLLALFLATPSFLAASPRDETDLNKFIEEYFASWSRVDFEGYAHCFHPDATISFIGNGGLNTWGAAEFIADQRAMQTQGRSKEIPLSIVTKGLWSHGALVEVEWELTPGNGGPKKTGLDIFHLVRAKENTPWRIIYLSFWLDPTIGQAKANEEELASVESAPKANAEEATAETLSVVVSGFGPFGGREINASSELAKAIKAAFPQHDIDLQIIPVEWGAPGEAVAALETQPDLWLAFGEGTRNFRLETIADNKRGNHPDVTGETPATPQTGCGPSGSAGAATGARSAPEPCTPAPSAPTAACGAGAPTRPAPWASAAWEAGTTSSPGRCGSAPARPGGPM